MLDVGFTFRLVHGVVSAAIISTKFSMQFGPDKQGSIPKDFTTVFNEFALYEDAAIRGRINELLGEDPSILIGTIFSVVVDKLVALCVSEAGFD